jgi:hypothetical protein
MDDVLGIGLHCERTFLWPAFALGGGAILLFVAEGDPSGGGSP